jgi:hypothetical protein
LGDKITYSNRESLTIVLSESHCGELQVLDPYFIASSQAGSVAFLPKCSNMSLLITLFFLAASVAAQTHYLYGPQWGWYSVATSGYILSAETTLHPGAPPNPAAERLALWPGMNTAMGLIQPIIVSSSERAFQGAYVPSLPISIIVNRQKRLRGKKVE